MSGFRRDACPCGGIYEWRSVDVTRGDTALHGVPQGACPECGARVYLRPTLERIEAVVWAAEVDPVLERVSRLSGP
jgi:hypothetical protein